MEQREGKRGADEQDVDSDREPSGDQREVGQGARTWRESLLEENMLRDAGDGQSNQADKHHDHHVAIGDRVHSSRWSPGS